MEEWQDVIFTPKGSFGCYPETRWGGGWGAGGGAEGAAGQGGRGSGEKADVTTQSDYEILQL